MSAESRPIVQVQHLRHTYSDGRIALNDLQFSIEAGERVALLGPNGAGKTTLFLRLCGVLAGKPGQITIAHLDPAQPKDRAQLPAQVGIVFQNPDEQLFSATVFDDVVFGPLNLGLSPAEAKERAEEALRVVGLTDVGSRLPHRLSGGEKRRVALAGVLAMRPELLLLDEPTMYLDGRGRRDLIGLLNRLPGTIVIATHDLGLVRATCRRVIILDHGAIVADGPTEAILSQRSLMTEYGFESE